jgi:ribonuclease VapC
MIVIDTSVIVAIALREPEADDFVHAIATDREGRISCASYVEAGNVMEGRFGPIGRAEFDQVMVELGLLGVLAIDVNLPMAELAREGFRRFGKGRHPAGLNLGDCFAYALARALDAPLLFKGKDFAKTDVQRI